MVDTIKKQQSSTSTSQKRTPFTRPFYVANTMEIFERLAWYGFFTVSSLYMTSPSEQGGLGFTDQQRGVLQGVIPFLLYLFPVFTGALGDRYGYRKMFLIAFAIMTPSYYLLGQAQSFWSFFIVFLLVAVGAAIFKPLVVGTVSRSTDMTNRGLGFGVFYTMVNVGGFLGPVIAGYMRTISWDWVFVMAAVWIAINFIPAFFFYRDPPGEPKSSSADSGFSKVFTEIQAVLGNGRFALMVIPAVFALMLAGGDWISWTSTFIFVVAWLVLNMLWRSSNESGAWYQQGIRVGNGPFLVYLLIMSGFWAIYQQLFITLPLYIRDFVDTQGIIMWLQTVHPALANTISHVNVEQLTGAVERLYANAAQWSDPQALRATVLELTSYQIRVPESELLALSQMTQLDNTAATELATQWAAQYGQVNPEYIMAFNFGSILLLQILISHTVQRFSVFPVLVTGTLVISASFLVAGFYGALLSGAGVLGAVLVFSIGEMLASPKSQEYVAAVMPSEKAAMFMGYYFVSMALGHLVGGILSGWGYGVLARDMVRPDLMWILFALVGVGVAVALMIFNKTMAHSLAVEPSQEQVTTQPQASSVA